MKRVLERRRTKEIDEKLQKFNKIVMPLKVQKRGIFRLLIQPNVASLRPLKTPEVSFYISGS